MKLELTKKQINRIKNSKNAAQTLANMYARKIGRGYATEVVFSKSDSEVRILKNQCYGLVSTSGKFYPHVTMSKFPYGGNCSGIECVVQLPYQQTMDIIFA